MSVLIIAEAGVNHDGSLERALELVDQARQAGADAVKFQTFRAAKLVSSRAGKARYQVETTGSGGSQLEMIQALELDEKAHEILAGRCAKLGIEFLSTPFDEESLDLLLALGVRRIKVGSGDLTHGPLLHAAGTRGKDVILSTGMATLGEVEEALSVLAAGFLGINPTSPGAMLGREDARSMLEARVTLLHCTTEYPAPLGEVNLRAMASLSGAFGLPVGYSNHTEGISVPLAAVALGATVIEKHFTLDRSLPGPDHRASIEPEELAAMVRGIRQVETALGVARKVPGPRELANVSAARRSLVALRPIRAGEKLGPENLGAKRPGTGVSPLRYWDYLGRIASRDYEADESIDP